MPFEPRAPVGPVQVVPPGLLNLLQLKVGGYAPDALAQTIQPVFDIEAYWMRATRKRILEAYTVTLPTAQYSVTQPLVNAALQTLGPTERAWWFVQEVGVMVASNATGIGWNLRLGWEENGGPFGGVQAFQVGECFRTFGAGVVALERIPMFARGFWMPPGSRFGLWLDQVTGAGGQIGANLQGFAYSEFPI